MPGPLETFPLGGSGLRVARLGLGTAPLGNLFTKVQEPDADATVDAALGAGITFVDTAPHYGLGVAERRLGHRLAGVPRDRFVLSTKVGRLVRPLEAGEMATRRFVATPAAKRVWDFSRDGVRRSLEESLERLGLDRVDVALVHDPDNHEREAAEQALPALAELRDQGMVRAIGAGMSQAEMLTRFVRELDLDLVLMAGRYSLLDQGTGRAATGLRRARVAAVIGGVFNSGLLADPGPGNLRLRPGRAELVERAGRLQAVCARQGVPLRAAALAFPFGHPAVASVLVGARTAAEVQDAVAMVGRPVPRSSGPSWSPKACARPSPVPTS